MQPYQPPYYEQGLGDVASSTKHADSEKGGVMPTIEEKRKQIREDLAKLFLKTPEYPYTDSDELAELTLKFLSEQGVVIKVDREYTVLIGSQEFVAVKPLIGE